VTCGKEKTENMITLDEKKYHEECVKCVYCNQNLKHEQYKMIFDQPMCFKCDKEDNILVLDDTDQQFNLI